MPSVVTKAGFDLIRKAVMSELSEVANKKLDLLEKETTNLDPPLGASDVLQFQLDVHFDGRIVAKLGRDGAFYELVD